MLACINLLIGAKRQYYPFNLPEKDINDTHPDYNPYNLLIRTIDDYWKTIERLNDVKGKQTQYKDIETETGVSGLPICAASPAFSHPFFFPLDPFHLFYENCMPHFWDTWVTFSEPSEIVYMSKKLASTLGAEVKKAMATLPPSFSGHIRDPDKKCHS